MKERQATGTEMVKASAASEQVTMGSDDIVRICTRLFKNVGLWAGGRGRKTNRWKRRAAEMLNRTRDSVHHYANGRQAVPRRIAMELWKLDRMMNEAAAEIAAGTIEEKQAAWEARLNESWQRAEQKANA